MEDGNVIVVAAWKKIQHAREKLSDGQKTANGQIEKKPDAPQPDPSSCGIGNVGTTATLLR